MRRARNVLHVLGPCLAFTVGTAASACTREAPHADAGTVLDAPVVAEDVSILWPLPTDASDTFPFTPRSEGGHGALVPKAVEETLPPLTTDTEREATYASLRLAAVRLDPCFARTDLADDCRAQIRLVFQPVRDATGSVESVDAALHVFFDVPRAELVSLVTTIHALRDPAADGTTLGIHSRFASEGRKGTFGSALAQALMPSIGAARLRRVTFMALPVDKHEWVFGGTDVDGDTVAPVVPKGSTEARQRVAGSTSTDGSAIARTTFVANDDVRPALSGGVKALDDDDARAALTAARRLEDPTVHSPESTDCASCHLAHAAIVALGTRKSADASTGPGVPSFTSNVRSAGSPPSSFRAFGWFGKEPSVSARAANETSVVVDAFATLLRAR
ncbi:MAG: hypothetical protein U0169_15955 [Polyangiaceae bacterium]